MATIHHLSSKSGVEAAWEAYVALAQQVSGDYSLLADAQFNIRLARAWARWRDLFLADEAA